jgi:hypothetical protein
MLKMLRVMYQWELAEVCRAAGVPEGARPEEIIRALSGAWWATPWGAVEEERVLLLRAAEALNLLPRLRHHRHRLGLVERMVYGALIQQAFVAAPIERQYALLSAAEAHLEAGHPVLAAPEPPALFRDEHRQLFLQRLVSTGAGLRAVTQALVEVPVQPTPPELSSGPSALFTALAGAGPEAWGSRVVEWIRARRGPDMHGLFHVLHLCWRQRQRLLLELRTSVSALRDEERRLMARLQALAADRMAARRQLPWHRRASSGLAVTAGAIAAASAEAVLATGIHDTAFYALGLGCAWTVTAIVASARAGGNPSRRGVLEELRRARRQREQLERQVMLLEE